MGYELLLIIHLQILSAMNMIKNPLYLVLSTFVLLFMASCEPSPITPESCYTLEDNLEAILEAENPDYGYRLYSINDFKKEFMSEKGDFGDAETPYRQRATNGKDGIYLFSIDTIPTDTIGIYLRGRVSTDDYAGNFYSALVIQQDSSWWWDPTDTDPANDMQQQNLRISVNMGSIGGYCQLGQEILIRCNGLAIGRYANQPQLCVPAYNNNVYARSWADKVGWYPGRIPAAQFRNAVRLIGQPDPSKLIYDECTPLVLFTKRGIQNVMTNTIEDMQKIRLMDGRLMRLKNVCFTGKYFDEYGQTQDCIYAHPDSSGYVNVFAPTTENVGYPQSRVLKQSNSNKYTICCSNSEYCKFANYLLPGAREDSLEAVTYCANWQGTISGILSWYCDNASKEKPGGLLGLCGKEWSITPRGIPGVGVPDFDIGRVNKQGKRVEDWVPKEFDPKFYNEYKHGPKEEQEE